MNVRFFTQNGQEIDITQLNQEFMREFLSKNPFGLLILGTLQLASDALKGNLSDAPESVAEAKSPLLLAENTTSSDENLFNAGDAILREEPQCSGDPENCPICNPGIIESAFLSDFSEALEEMKNGEFVTRREWATTGVTGHLCIIPETTYAENFTTGAYIAFYDSEENTYTPYSPNNFDLMAEDWLLINKG